MNELKSPLISNEQAALIAKGDSDVLNCEEAKEFIKSVPDPADREALWLAYGVLGLGMSGVNAAGKIDVLYFMKAFAKVLEQRDELLRILGCAAQMKLACTRPWFQTVSYRELVRRRKKKKDGTQ